MQSCLYPDSYFLFLVGSSEIEHGDIPALWSLSYIGQRNLIGMSVGADPSEIPVYLEQGSQTFFKRLAEGGSGILLLRFGIETAGYLFQLHRGLDIPERRVAEYGFLCNALQRCGVILILQKVRGGILWRLPILMMVHISI